MYIDSKAHPNKKHRSQIGEIIRELAEAQPLHDSPNTVKTVIDLERRSVDQPSLADEDPVRFVWALVFDIPDNDANAQQQEAQEEEELSELDRAPVNAKLRISHEAWMACEQIVSADLCLRHAVSLDCKTLILAFGAPHSILVEEAKEMKILMRLQETKG